MIVFPWASPKAFSLSLLIWMDVWHLTALLIVACDDQGYEQHQGVEQEEDDEKGVKDVAFYQQLWDARRLLCLLCFSFIFGYSVYVYLDNKGLSHYCAILCLCVCQVILWCIF